MKKQNITKVPDIALGGDPLRPEANSSATHLRVKRKAKQSSNNSPRASLPLANRELGILAFNERVLAQAADTRVPLLERLRFVCIVSANLDEFFEIRFAGLKEQVLLDPDHREADGMAAAEVIGAVRERTRALIERQYQILSTEVLPALQAAQVNLHYRPEWTPALTQWCRKYFDEQVLPVLTPIGLDPAHPFPRILNKSLNIAVELEGRDAFGREAKLAIVQAPRALPRLIAVPKRVFDVQSRDERADYILLSTVLMRFVGELFPGLQVRGCHPFRVTRNSDLFVDEEEVTNLRQALAGEFRRRSLNFCASSSRWMTMIYSALMAR
jgi:polyphosphate kinase